MTAPTRNIIVSVADGLSKEHKTSKYVILTWYSLWWRAILAEFISTALLVLLGCMACIPIDGYELQPPLNAAFGFGFVVLFNVQVFGHISGAHMNPCVTLSAVLYNKMSVALGLAYVAAQCLGSIVGFAILIEVSPTDLISEGICTTQPHVKHTDLQTLGTEVILTASLIFLVCAIWDPINSSHQESNSLKFGFAIAGFSIAGGSLSGASMNPARTLGPALLTDVWRAHWVYWVGPLLGSMLATLFYKHVLSRRIVETKASTQE